MKNNNSLPNLTKEEIRNIYKICELTYDGAPIEMPNDQFKNTKKEKQLEIYKIWYPNGKIRGKTNFEQASKYQRNALVSKIMEEARKLKKTYEENKSYYDASFNQIKTENTKESDLEKKTKQPALIQKTHYGTLMVNPEYKVERNETNSIDTKVEDPKPEEKPKYQQGTLF